MYLFLSDLHLGSPLFKIKNELLKLITDDKYSRIYIIGDIIDTWEEDYHKVVSEFKDVIDCINNSPKFIVLIKGNHDPEISIMKFLFPNKPVYFKYETSLGNNTALLFHGDEFDYKITKHITLARFLFPIQWFLERLGFNFNWFTLNLYHSISKKVQHKKYDALVLDIEKEAVEKYKDYDLIIMGHTHKHKLIKLSDNRYYINTGALINYPVYAEFNEEDSTFTIKKFEGVEYNDKANL